MNEKIELTKPVEIKDNGEAKTAFELMNLIAKEEVTHSGNGYPRARVDNARDYYLNLFIDCREAVGFGRRKI